MLAAQIQNLPPTPAPPPPQVVAAKPRRRRTGGGDWPESNLYDPIEGDPHNEFFDENIAAANAASVEVSAQAELADLTAWGQLLANILADALTVEVAALETQVMVDSVATATTASTNTETGVTLGSVDVSASAPPPPRVDVTVDVFDVVVDTGDDD